MVDARQRLQHLTLLFATFLVSRIRLEKAIEGAGTLDRAAVTQYIKDHSFDTVMGEITFETNDIDARKVRAGRLQVGEQYFPAAGMKARGRRKHGPGIGLWVGRRNAVDPLVDGLHRTRCQFHIEGRKCDHALPLPARLY